jgi:hypothetical protein
MTLYIAPVVEGQTEQGCVERLLHRIWHELLCSPERLQVVEPFRGHRDSLTHSNGKVLAETVLKASLKLQAASRRDRESQSLLLILLDAEGDCPATLAPRLLKVAAESLPAGTPIACVLAKRMLENWIVAGASTLAGVNGLPDPLPAQSDVEDCSGVGWLTHQLRSKNKTRAYKKTVDAKEFIAKMALQECRDNSLSFDKLCRELESRLPSPPPPPPDPPPQHDQPAE